MTKIAKLASDPAHSAAVIASAGTGKTWTLVSRMLRLLLGGAEPGNLLAITFTVKAAAEMKQRLLERLATWSNCSDLDLEEQLAAIQHPVNAKSKQRARQLYEEQLHASSPTRALTFHAFFQELLSQLSIEAGVPTGFELTQNTIDHQQLAWEALSREVHLHQDSELSQNLLLLLDHLGTTTTETALNNFLNQRSDWWAWTENLAGTAERISFAQEKLGDTLKPEPDKDHYADFFNDVLIQRCKLFVAIFIDEVHTKTNRAIAISLDNILSSLSPQLARQHFDGISDSVLTKAKNKTVRKISTNAKVRKQYGEEKVADAVEAINIVGAAILDTKDQILRVENYNLNGAWYFVGEHYLKYFQQQKRQQRQLDFSDLEWKACQLLNNGDEFSLALRKLDEKIEHLLIDEFQDTNPTQWRFLMPLLKDFKADSERKNNLFIVGDSKQSIYGFRRANPELLGEAASWVSEQHGGEVFHENRSWRSSPAIMECVNTLFSESGYAKDIVDFTEHDTHKNDLWGRVEIWPEFVKPKAEKKEEAIEFRNPLLEPRETKHTPYLDEAIAIAEKIDSLINDGLEITTSDTCKRAIEYSDIMILVRNRTHVGNIERELQARNIPFRGSSRGTFMERLEIKDLCALLHTLATPGDNLSLAQVLRSPLFSLTTEDLMVLSEAEGERWYNKLKHLTQDTENQKFTRAVTLLEDWQKQAAKLPLHDLITHIYHQGNLVLRYLSAFPDWQGAQLEANLERFVELALENNSGRYPGIHHFLANLQLQTAAQGEAALSEPIPGAAHNTVNILTIHQAKGLEAPVVFFANCNGTTNSSTAHQCIVDWPSDKGRPDLIALMRSKDKLDKTMQALAENQRLKEQQEAANLLYVAITRAKQMLVISGSQPRPGNSDNSNKTGTRKIPEMKVLQQLFSEQDHEGEIIVIQTGPPVWCEHGEKTSTPTQATKLPDDIGKKLKLSSFDPEIAPSRGHASEDVIGTIDGRLRGNIIHFFLHQLTLSEDLNEKALISKVAAEHSLDANDTRLTQWLSETKVTVEQHPTLFSPSSTVQSFSELPVVYQLEQKRVYGIIDLVLLETDKITVLDFKSHRIKSAEQEQLALSFADQLSYYRDAVKLLWPEREVTSGILFTYTNQIIWLP